MILLKSDGLAKLMGAKLSVCRKSKWGKFNTSFTTWQEKWSTSTSER